MLVRQISQFTPTNIHTIGNYPGCADALSQPVAEPGCVRGRHSLTNYQVSESKRKKGKWRDFNKPSKHTKNGGNPVVSIYSLQIYSVTGPITVCYLQGGKSSATEHPYQRKRALMARHQTRERNDIEKDYQKGINDTIKSP